MKKLADHIRQASKDVEEVHISSKKITDRFAKIERVDLEHPTALPDVGGDLDASDAPALKEM
jgi:DNA recombination protein RmuC